MVRIGGRRAAHLIDVLGVEVGATVEAGVLDGRIGRATVERVEAGAVVLRTTMERDPPPRLDIRLVLALPRPKGLRRILQGCAAMGVRSIHLINSWRVEKSYWGSPLLAPDRIREELALGAEQGRDTVLPEVEIHSRFKPFVEDRLPRIAEGTRRLVGDGAAAAKCPARVSEAVTLVIGPEGGLIPYEVETLRSIDFEAVRIGRRAMRVEQAVPAFLGRLVD